MAASRTFLVTLAKTVLLAIPLVIAYMFVVAWFFDWMSETHGVQLPRWLSSLIMLIGIFGITAVTIGSDLMAMKRENELMRTQKPK